MSKGTRSALKHLARDQIAKLHLHPSGLAEHRAATIRRFDSKDSARFVD